MADAPERHLKCITCAKHAPFRVHVTPAPSPDEWEVYPAGWFLLVHSSGVILPACSEECADAHSATEGQAPTVPWVARWLQINRGA